MKKLTFMAAMAIAVAAMTSCGNGTPKADLKNDIDSLSYAIGMAQTQGLKEYLAGAKGIDTTYIADFIKGLNDGVKASDNKKQAAYYAGIEIGQQLGGDGLKRMNMNIFGEDTTKTLSMKNFLAAFITATQGKEGLMTMEQANEIVPQLIEQIKKRIAEEQYSDNRKAGEDFLAKKAKESDVKKLESGVLYKVIKEGTGAVPADTSTVTVHYEGRLINDTVFDSSYKRNQPMTVRANQNIKGFTDALTHMPAGSVWEIYIPQELAYAERQPSMLVKPFSALIFKVELLEVK
jgi:FKBP-type peptidyl-prolyl cis-trans isomerase FklB